MKIRKVLREGELTDLSEHEETMIYAVADHTTAPREVVVDGKYHVWYLLPYYVVDSKKMFVMLGFAGHCVHGTGRRLLDVTLDEFNEAKRLAETVAKNMERDLGTATYGSIQEAIAAVKRAYLLHVIDFEDL